MCHVLYGNGIRSTTKGGFISVSLSNYLQGDFFSSSSEVGWVDGPVGSFAKAEVLVDVIFVE